MRNLLFLLSILHFMTIWAQAPEIEWSMIYGGDGDDYPRYIQQTNDNGYIIVGYTRSDNGDVSGSHGGNDIWVLKIDENGQIEWQKCLAIGQYYDEFSYSAQQTTDNGYIIAGFIEGLNKGWIIKLDNIGNTEWEVYTPETYDDYRLASIRQTSDGGYVASGQKIVGGDFGLYYYYVIKLNNSGEIEWDKFYGGGDGTLYIGMLVGESANSIQQTSDGGFIIAGESGPNDLNSDSWHEGYSDNRYVADYWVIKLDALGEIEWQKCYGGSGRDFAKEIIQTNDGGYIVAGTSWSNDGDITSSKGNNDFWIVKLDNNGAIEWQKSYGGIGYEEANTIKQTVDGGYIIGGSTSGSGYTGDVDCNLGSQDSWILKINESGEIEWQKCLGNNLEQEAYSVYQTSDNGYIIATKSNFYSGYSGYNYWIFKLFSEQMSNDETSNINDFILYPNPANNILNFSSKLKDIKVYNINGELVLIDNNVSKITTQNLSSGTYILTASKVNGDKIYTKFIKR